MSSYREIANRRERPFDVRLLYVPFGGSSPNVLKTIHRLGCMTHVRELEGRPSSLRDVAGVVEQEPLWPDAYHKAVVLVFDLGDRSGCEEIEQFLDGVPNCSEPWSTQVIGFILSQSEAAIPFTTFKACVDADIAGVGDLAALEAAVINWCGLSPDASSMRLRIPCLVNPAWRLRGMGHDYLVKIKAVEKQLVEAGLFHRQQVADGWLRALRNVLLSQEEVLSELKLRELSPEEAALSELPCADVAGQSSCRLLASRPVAERLRGMAWPDPAPVVCEFESDNEISRLLSAQPSDARVILFHNARDVTRNDAQLREFPVRPPQILVGDQCRMSWAQWQSALAGNCLGAFSEDELFGTLAKQGVLAGRLNYWTAFCDLSLSGAVDLLVDVMAETQLHIERESVEINLDLLSRALDQTRLAKGLYFGEERAAAH